MYVASVFIYVIHVPIDQTTNNTWNKNATRAFVTKVMDRHHHLPSDRNFTGHASLFHQPAQAHRSPLLPPAGRTRAPQY